MNNSIAFETTLLQTGNNTGIRVPDELIEQLRAGKKPPVLVTLNNFTYQSTVGVMGGIYLIPVSAAIRKSAGVNGGETIQVIVELDSEPRVIALPTDFQRALDANEGAKVTYFFFETLSPSSKKKYVTLVESAKSDQTRLNRIEKAIADLVKGKR